MLLVTIPINAKAVAADYSGFVFLDEKTQVIGKWLFGEQDKFHPEKDPFAATNALWEDSPEQESIQTPSEK